MEEIGRVVLRCLAYALDRKTLMRGYSPDSFRDVFRAKRTIEPRFEVEGLPSLEGRDHPLLASVRRLLLLLDLRFVSSREGSSLDSCRAAEPLFPSRGAEDDRSLRRFSCAPDLKTLIRGYSPDSCFVVLGVVVVLGVTRTIVPLLLSISTAKHRTLISLFGEKDAVFDGYNSVAGSFISGPCSPEL